MSTFDLKPYLRRAWLLTLIGVMLMTWSATYSAPTPVGAQGDVTYPAGWNLISGPTGSTVSGAAGSLYTLNSGDTDYVAVRSTAPLLGCFGYWAYFPTGGSLTFSRQIPVNGEVAHGFGNDICRRNLAPYQALLIGNPSATGTAELTGINILERYDPVKAQAAGDPSAGWINSLPATLPPGQGALIQGDGANGNRVDLLIPTQLSKAAILTQSGTGSDPKTYSFPLNNNPSIRIHWTISGTPPPQGRNTISFNLYGPDSKLVLDPGLEPRPTSSLPEGDLAVPSAGGSPLISGTYSLQVDAPAYTTWTVTVYTQ